MTYKIVDSIFRSITVPYGGAFFIRNAVDLEVKNIQIYCILTTSCVSINGNQIGGAGFIFDGNNFCGSNICAYNLSSNYKSSICVYSGRDTVVFNTSSASTCQSHSRAFLFGKVNCLLKEENITYSTVDEYAAAVHFGWYPTCYYQEYLIGCNNTGQTIIGHSCSSTNEQKCRNMAFISNNASLGVLGFWRYNHRLINSYLLHNTGSTFYKVQENAVITFEDCYSKDTTRVIVTKSKTAFETDIFVNSLACKRLHQLSFINIRKYSHQHRLSDSFLFCILQVSD
jgi:hypothetical protein